MFVGIVRLVNVTLKLMYFDDDEADMSVNPIKDESSYYGGTGYSPPNTSVKFKY